MELRSWLMTIAELEYRRITKTLTLFSLRNSDRSYFQECVFESRCMGCIPPSTITAVWSHGESSEFGPFKRSAICTATAQRWMYRFQLGPNFVHCIYRIRRIACHESRIAQPRVESSPKPCANLLHSGVSEHFWLLSAYSIKYGLSYLLSEFDDSMEWQSLPTSPLLSGWWAVRTFPENRQ